ncbi:MAG: hypothetical protein MPK06_01945 [Alphaproteobacteria bacterium]|nr:hypothetical protein [Alphaproteobacteria bacterium]MDA8003592.1 hypothetical protein [Alphaproteobacteria bacterium]MDA8005291.1 hypothetical protein [Alphaproteobacteria bacterium]MDA8012847.1 hypothetical protein [Alphaproteobacteria bacterium]
MADIPTKAALEKAWRRAEKIHSDHLEQHGVKLPEWGTAKGCWLAILFHYSGKEVDKNRISEITRHHFPDFAPDQQVRHLKRDGWNDEGTGGKHKILNPKVPHPNFANSLKNRTGNLTNADFDTLKKAFNNCCATCGAEEGKEHPKYRDPAVVKLHKGHCDPHKELTVGNTIPQCQYCNRAYRDDFVFERDGRVKAVASVRPVRRASKSVQDEVRKFLKTNASRQD